MRSLRFRAEDAVAFLVLAQRIGGGGDVDEEVDIVVAIELSERRQAVVIAPAVLAEQTADAIPLSVDVERQRREETLRRRADLPRELLEAEKMTGIIELTIVWQQRLDDKGVRHVVRCDETTILGAEERIVFAHAAVIVLLFPVDGNVAEQDDNALGSADDVGAVALAVAQESGLLPCIAEQVSWDAHLREDDDISLLLLGFSDHLQHTFRIFIRVTGRNLHLCHRDVQHRNTPLELHFYRCYNSSCLSPGRRHLCGIISVKDCTHCV